MKAAIVAVHQVSLSKMCRVRPVGPCSRLRTTAGLRSRLGGPLRLLSRAAPCIQPVPSGLLPLASALWTGWL
jgi:hypothetical protein